MEWGTARIPRASGCSGGVGGGGVGCVASTNEHVFLEPHTHTHEAQTHPSKDAVVEAEPVSVRDVRGTNIIRTTSCDLGRGNGLPFGGGACHR